MDSTNSMPGSGDGVKAKKTGANAGMWCALIFIALSDMRYLLNPVIVLLLWLTAAQPAVAQDPDINMLCDMHLRRERSLDAPLQVISDWSAPVAVAIPLTELLAGYARHDTAIMVNGLQTAAAYALTGVVTIALKYGVNRPRPATTYPYLQPYEPYTDHSFPSGHTSLAFSAATSLSLSYPRWYVVAPAFVWASAVGYSRLHLGVHYPSDVLAGAIVGAGSSWLAWKGNKWLRHRMKMRRKMAEP